MEQLFVLLVEDDQEILRIFDSKFPENTGPVRMSYASTVEEARALMRQHFFHIALVDISLNEMEDNHDGTFVLAELRTQRPSCRRFALTRDPEYAARKLVRARAPLVQGILTKNEEWDIEFIEEQAQRWLSHTVRVSGLEEVVSNLCNKLQAPHPTREELDYLVSKIFGQGAAVPTSIKEVELKILEGGRSGSVVVRGQPRDESGREGIWTVIKFSRLLDARAEYEAYCKHVRFMLPLSRRVELLGFFEADTVGAMCYSFAGGSPQDEITSLESLIREEDENSFGYLDALHDSLGASWYVTESTPENQCKYVFEKFGVDETMVRKKMHNFAIDLAPQLGAVVQADGLSFRGHLLRWPTSADLTQGQLRERPRCIIHGDLHAGNLLIRKGTKQVVLIDYQFTGPGPACLDFAALDASPRVFTNVSAIDLEAVEDQATFEPKVWDAVWSAPLDAKAPHELPFWARVSFQVIMLARMKFPTLRPKDYAGTCVLWVLRLFKGKGLTDVTRLQLLVWTSHLLQVLRARSDYVRTVLPPTP